ncbi:FKBP-type peptidyl-prolyl cis-trans isomerase [Saccharophagus degradans]|uniref:Peptidyl-prolyl cis-trans isomerase n=1 Tax=Saccharophagus degradans TaxID=86304 RepID=A0AAW7X9Y0_9GAMM|nr:FKBP-type peptidyl-prolyl cis-trans isomerase [Saccharophagus degradans]MDO6424680.1 FKBP-type peptidyl-prolyl cis-trans isomerase [Saccharophagus degradans]MDO6609013.1 FKBP-type peptidyl-prolyl cis-trans isomerase [Saccharophagus degradans]
MEVTLHFALTLEDGAVVDSNFESKPATFVVGDGKLLPGFEQAIFGLIAGDKKAMQIPPEQGFGQPNPNNIQEVKRKVFAADMELAQGLVVSFADANGGEMPGVIAEIGEDIVKVDFNHPLAGREITFEVEIISVKPATTH